MAAPRIGATAAVGDLGTPQGREADFARPVVVVTAQRVLDQGPSMGQVVPLTSKIRGYRSEVTIEPDPDNGLEAVPAGSASTSARSPSSGSLHRSATLVRRRLPRCARSSPTSSTADEPFHSRDYGRAADRLKQPITLHRTALRKRSDRRLQQAQCGGDSPDLRAGQRRCSSYMRRVLA
jgi:hypothetical protein